MKRVLLWAVAIVVAAIVAFMGYQYATQPVLETPPPVPPPPQACEATMAAIPPEKRIHAYFFMMLPSLSRVSRKGSRVVSERERTLTGPSYALMHTSRSVRVNRPNRREHDAHVRVSPWSANTPRRHGRAARMSSVAALMAAPVTFAPASILATSATRSF